MQIQASNSENQISETRLDEHAVKQRRYGSIQRDVVRRCENVVEDQNGG